MAATLLSVYRAMKKEFGPQKWWPARTRFEVIVGAILTQNTSWSNVVKAIKNLRKNKMLGFEPMRQARTGRLAKMIRPAGYFNVKAKRLQNFLKFLQNEYSGNLPRLFNEETDVLREKLLSVKGIGPETADSIALYAAKKPIFVVDAYTKRIFSRLGFMSEKSSYVDTQSYFMKRLPRSERLFNEYHALIVAHAKHFCLKKPKCADCFLVSKCSYAIQRVL